MLCRAWIKLVQLQLILGRHLPLPFQGFQYIAKLTTLCHNHNGCSAIMLCRQIDWLHTVFNLLWHSLAYINSVSGDHGLPLGLWLIEVPGITGTWPVSWKLKFGSVWQSAASVQWSIQVLNPGILDAHLITASRFLTWVHQMLIHFRTYSI